MRKFTRPEAAAEQLTKEERQVLLCPRLLFFVLSLYTNFTKVNPARRIIPLKNMRVSTLYYTSIPNFYKNKEEKTCPSSNLSIHFIPEPVHGKKRFWLLICKNIPFNWNNKLTDRMVFTKCLFPGYMQGSDYELEKKDERCRERELCRGLSTHQR